MTTNGWTAALALALAITLSGTAQASEVSLEHPVINNDGISGAPNYATGWIVEYRGGDERNDMRVSYAGRDRVRITDSAGITPKATGCVADGPTAAVCTVTDRAMYRQSEPVFDIFDLDDGDDRFAVDGIISWSQWGVSIGSGAGNDVVLGSPGDDDIASGPGRDRLDGRGGDDYFSGAEEYRKATEPDVFEGGPGTDTVSYSATLRNPDARRGVHADLEGDADDGTPGEGDRIGRDVESLEGSTYDDVLIGNGKDNTLDGIDGSDRIMGGAGDDTIRFLEDVGPDAVVDPGPGRDDVMGAPLVRARDGERDKIRPGESGCGTVIADRIDRVRGCKRVKRPRRN